MDWNEFIQYFTRRGYPVFDGNMVMLDDMKREYNRKTEKSRQERNENVNFLDEYLWNIPKCRRKEYLRNKLALKEFIKIFGRQNDINDQRRYQVTVPEPFNFGESRSHGYRKIFVDQLLAEKVEADRRKEVVARKIPKHVKQNLYEQMLEKERQFQLEKEQRRDQWMEEQRLAQEQILPEFMQEVNLADIKTKWHYDAPPTFKAREMPEYCKPGLYDELVESKYRMMREARDRMKKAREMNEEKPYWSTMPERFQKYEIEKFQKLEDQKNKDLEASKAMRKKKVDTRPRDFDWKEHFERQQKEFRDELDQKKATHRATLKACEPEEFNLSKGKPHKVVRNRQC